MMLHDPIRGLKMPPNVRINCGQPLMQKDCSGCCQGRHLSQRRDGMVFHARLATILNGRDCFRLGHA